MACRKESPNPQMGDPPAAARAQTLRAILAMVGAMAAFALCDTCIKLATATLPPGQVLAVIGATAGALFALQTWRRGQPVWTRRFLHPVILLRNAAEVTGTIGFVVALSYVPLALATAVQQATPLAITLGAALVLGERVGPWRWGAVAAGFAGVLLIVRPGFAGFDVYALWALLPVVSLTVRDLTTRFLPPGTGTPLLAAWAFLSFVPTGLAMLPFGGGTAPIGQTEALYLGGASLCAMLGYTLITASLRAGDVSAVAPYRYTRMAFALLIATVFLGERPDIPMLAGLVLIVGAGLVVLWREARLSQPA